MKSYLSHKSARSVSGLIAVIAPLFFMGFTPVSASPTIKSISPAVATPNGGTVITISGTGFVKGGTVTFGPNSSTTLVFVNTTTLHATTPPATNKAEGKVDVTATNPDHSSATLANGLFYQFPAPAVTKVTPAVASTKGGTVITITGKNFISGATVSIGANPATNVTFVNTTTLKATAPVSTLTGDEQGEVSVSVTNPDTLSGSLANALNYHTPPTLSFVSPAYGLPAGGYTVTLTGKFRCDTPCAAAPTVTFGSTPATSVVFVNSTTLMVTVPAGTAGSVNVTEKNSDGLATTLKSGFTYTPTLVTAVTPNIGPLSGGNTVTIQGLGFTPGTTVNFGTTPGTSVKVSSTNTLTVHAPAHAGGAVSITVSNAGGSSALPNAYQYSGRPIVTSISPISGPLAGGNTVTISGYNLKSLSSVLFNAASATIVSAANGTLKVTSPAFAGGPNPVSIQLTSPGGSTTAPAAYFYVLTVLTQGLDDAYAGFPYSNTLKVTGGTPPYNWSITSGSLPSGLTLNSSTGVISGTPDPNYAIYPLGLQVTDSATPPNSGSTSLSFNVVFGFTTDVIPPDFFGMILYDQTIWPTVSFGALGKGLATTWPFIEQTQGSYNWTALDQYVADAKSHQIPGTNQPLTLYWTNANVPPWAVATTDQDSCTPYLGTNPPILACTAMVSPDHMQDFTNFMTALINRYQGTIQIYELWNEPNVPNVYTGSLADFATLTSTAYNLIRTLDPSATILSPSATGAPWLLSYWTTPGAPLGVDGVAIHGYPQVTQNDVPEAITGFKSVNVKLAMAQAPGIGVKPIWDTESSWGGPLAITDASMRAAYVARSFLLHWSAGIHKMYWYGWDSPQWGTLYFPPPGVGATPAAAAYQQTFDWMVGASMPAPCTANGGSLYQAVYTCQLTRSGGYNALAVWDTTQTCDDGTCTTSSFAPDPQYIQYRDLTGAVTSITPGQTIQIGAQPILLENMAVPDSSEEVPKMHPVGSGSADQVAFGPVSTGVSFSYTGLTPVFATTAAHNPSSPAVPASGNLAPTGSPAPHQVALSNLIVKPGLSAPAAGTEAIDSDATLAVGTTQVMQWADFRLQVFDKNANPVGTALDGNRFWSASSPCSGGVGADGTVQFDKMASVWVVAMRSGPNTECLAVSQTSDATQQYNEYALNYRDPSNSSLKMDYPKLGVWPDAYYITFDMLDSSRNFAPAYAVVCALERSAMLLGSGNAEAICLTTSHSNSTGFFHLLPSDLDSATPPPAGSPNYLFTFAKPVGATWYHLYGYQFQVNFATPTASTLTGPVQIDTNAFANIRPACNAGSVNCVPQPSPALWPLDSVGGYLMGRAAYRNFGKHESLLLSQAVQSTTTSPVGVRWYELRNLQKGATIYQKGFLQSATSSTKSDTFSRWMSSATEDNVGNIALGYSISGPAATSYYSGLPGLAIDGRVPTTPLNTLLTEEIVFPGVSVEQPTPPKKIGRWGAVSGMAIDPVDQCTFWFTGQYEPTAGTYNWSTALVSFTLPACH